MSNPSKRKGTSWEGDVAQFLRDNGFGPVERRALAGSNDRGDIAGIPGVVIEAKNCKTITLGAWLDEATREKVNDAADVGVVWIKRRGFTTAGRGYVVMDGWQFVDLLEAAGYRPKRPEAVS